MKSWRSGTQAAYNSSEEKWAGWCSELQADPFRATVASFIDFLSDMHKAGFTYDTISGYHSAVSAWHNSIDGTLIGQHCLVQQAMTGVFNEKPLTPRCQETWDLDIVLMYIASISDNPGLEDATLMHKLVTLLALTTASRASELNSLKLEYIIDNSNSIVSRR